jgi:multiple sugar transport system permease protein/sn-glycerol 3-phosphate transport system permease protein
MADVAFSASAPQPRAVPRSRAWTAPYLYVAPMALLLGAFTYWPFLGTVYLSLVDWNLAPGTTPRFIGVANYADVVASPLFRAAAVNTAVYIAAAIPLKVLLPIPIAMFLWSLGPRGHAYRTILFLPTLLSFVVVSVVVLWLFNPIGGQVPTALRWLGLAIGNPLTDADAAIWVVIGVSAWKLLGFNVLLYLAGLSGIDRAYVEAMRIDGAGDAAILRHLVWPLLSPTTLFVLIATVIFTLQQIFTPIDVMTQGGPLNATTNLFYVVYQYAFRAFNVGYAAAGTVMLFAGLLALTILKLRVLDRRVHYDP